MRTLTEYDCRMSLNLTRPLVAAVGFAAQAKLTSMNQYARAAILRALRDDGFEVQRLSAPGAPGECGGPLRPGSARPPLAPLEKT